MTPSGTGADRTMEENQAAVRRVALQADRPLATSPSTLSGRIKCVKEEA